MIDTIYGGAPEPAHSSPTGVFRYPTIIRVRVSGTVTQVPVEVPLDEPIIRSATSKPDDPAYWGVMGFRSGGGIWWASDTAQLVRVVDTIYAFRNWAGGQPNGDNLHCGKNGYALCWTWSGTAVLSFERIHVGLKTLPAADTAVAPNSFVPFAALRDQDYIPGHASPVDISEVRYCWLADNASPGTGCEEAGSTSFQKEIVESGTMYMSAYVNGEWQEKSVHVSVKERCDTLYDFLNDETIKAALKNIWQGSNATASDHSTRVEKGGFIILGPGGYSFQPFNATAVPCGLDVPAYKPPGAVLFVHTHPWKFNEKMIGCGPVKLNGISLYDKQGNPIPAPYGGGPSEDDRETSRFWEMPGLVIDNENMTIFNYAGPFWEVPRCGY